MDRVDILIFAAQFVASARSNTFHQGFEGLSGFLFVKKINQRSGQL
jgi:hypothetical protein